MFKLDGVAQFHCLTSMLSSHILDIYHMHSHNDSESGHEVEASWITELFIVQVEVAKSW